MNLTKKARFFDWLNALALWLVLAISLGWYYTFSMANASGWPLPTPEACGGLAFHFFSYLPQSQAGVALQILHWTAGVLAAGILWVAVLSLTAPYFGCHNSGFHWSLFRFGLASLPLSLPGPFLTYAAGLSERGWSVHTLVQVMLRRAPAEPRGWTGPVYLLLALAALGCHLYVYRQTFLLGGKEAAKHFLLTLAIFVPAMAGLGAMSALPFALLGF